GGRGHGGEVRRESGSGAATHGFVQPHDYVARTVVGELDRLCDDPVFVDRDERLDGAAAGERPKRQVEAVALAGRVEHGGAGRQGVTQPVPAAVGVRVGEPRRSQQREAHGGGGPAVVADGAGDIVAVGGVVDQRGAPVGL